MPPSMKVLFFGLTGFGNKVLEALFAESCQVEFIFTRAEKGPYPYYPEENLSTYAKRKKMMVKEKFEWDEVEDIIKGNHHDLLLVATFHRIIPRRIISLVPLCVNIHPSLLPKYRGPTPIAWALFNGEKETGVTAHFLTERLDSGSILIQRKITIMDGDDENTLRRKLAVLAGEVSRDLISQIRSNLLMPCPQKEEDATIFPSFKRRP